jgi:hypothetical protein
VPTRGSARPQLAVFEGDDAVEAMGEFEIVGRNEGGKALGADDLDQDRHDVRPGGVVEIAGRLVGEEDLGVVGERANEGDALLFAAREPGGG